MPNPRDPYTTASADPSNADADYQRELGDVEDVADKIYRSGRGSGRLTSHIRAVRLLATVN
jgi:hypothetical protein